MKAIILNETFTKSKRIEIKKRVRMNVKSNKLIINTIIPGFNYKNKIIKICINQK